MSKPKEITRIYSIADADAIEESKTKHSLFEEDKAKFTAFDADFADPYFADWWAEIEAAEEVVKDSVVKDQMADLTGDVDINMDLCRSKYKHVKYFVKKAFPKNKAIWNEFGFNDYRKARNSQAKMIQFMKELHQGSVKYRKELIKAKFDQVRIDEIITLKNSLDAANLTQNRFISGRPVLTRDRIIILNKPWEKTRRVSEASKLVFDDDHAKYRQYLLPSTEEAASEEEEAIVEENL